MLFNPLMDNEHLLQITTIINGLNIIINNELHVYPDNDVHNNV